MIRGCTNRSFRIPGLAALAAVAVGLALLLAGRAEVPSDSSRGESVVLLHGLGRTRRAMSDMERALARAGYRVVNVAYPSRRKPVEQLAREDVGPMIEAVALQANQPVHFVTHSMGGIVLREYLARNPEFPVGRVVMLAPPSQGSELPDKLGHLPVFRWLNGPAGRQLTTGEGGVPAHLPRPHYPVGVLAGTRSLNPLYSALIPGPDDGKVSVARARLDGQADFLAVPYSHTWLMNREIVQRQTLRFLQAGRFDHARSQ